MGRQAGREEFFKTVSRGYDKEQVNNYLRDTMEKHTRQQEQLQELANDQEQAAANALAQLVALQQELGEALFDLQTAQRENERLRRENDDTNRKVLLADKMLASTRAEASASLALKEEMEHSLSAALEQNLRLEKQLEALKGDSVADSQQLEHLRSELAALHARGEQWEQSLSAALEQNQRLEQQLELLRGNATEDNRRQLEALRSELDALRTRNEELEGQMSVIRRKVMEAAKARQARQRTMEN